MQQSTVKLPLPTEDIMDLLNLCLTSTYFQYNGKHYKQLHGTAMDFHDHLNEQNADIQFTKEIEENGKLPFLDCLVSRDNNEL